MVPAIPSVVEISGAVRARRSASPARRGDATDLSAGQGSAREPSQRIENFFHCIRVTDDLPGRKSDVRAATLAQRDTSLLPTLLW